MRSPMDGGRVRRATLSLRRISPAAKHLSTLFRLAVASSLSAPLHLNSPPARALGAFSPLRCSMAMDASSGGISYVSAVDAAAIDEQLMGPDLGFSIDQLMELAGAPPAPFL
ncbi:hypothetical protein T484DRAFT_1800849 [Baffinella frigidus]|nr:hypothetical protein T484DRAFT_1800849 [Cryptophyta sp. CCMP2293]